VTLGERDFLELILTIVPLSPCIWLPTLSSEAGDRPIETTGNEQQEVNPMTALMAVAHGPATSGPRKVRTIVLPQRFDVHEVPQFKSAIDRMVTAGPVAVIDASEVRYMDRSAMDSLIEARLRCMDHGGDLTLAAPSVAARVILELSGRYDALNPIEAVARQHLTPAMEEAA